MKRNERRLLEEKIRYIAMENIELDPEREQQMLEQAKATLMRQGVEPAEKLPARHGMGRRVLIVSAAAVLVMVLSFGFTVLMPESVSHARGFVRTAAIWVNNTLHLGYEFDELNEKPVRPDEQDITYSTLEQAAQNVPYLLMYLDAPDLALRSVSFQDNAIFSKAIISYGNEHESCRIELTPIGEDTITDLDDGFQEFIPWQYGKFAFWEVDSTKYALTFYSNLEIYIISSDIHYDDFYVICQTLKPFN